MRKRLVSLSFAIILVGTVSGGAWGQDAYETEQSSPFWIRGLFDLCIVRGGSVPSWANRGFGKARYGGRSDAHGFERVTRFKFSQLALEVGGTLPWWDMTAQAQLNWETDVGDERHPLLVEAFLRKE